MAASHARPAPVVVLTGRIARAAIPELCRRAAALLETPRSELHCDVGRVHADVVAIEAVARLQLTALRLDKSIVLVDVTDELRELLALTGLTAVIACDSVEPQG